MSELLRDNSLMLFLLSIVIAYIIGCLNSAYYLTKFISQKDIRTVHSKNSGATNAGRLLGKYGFIAVLIIDLARGFLGIKICDRILTADIFSMILLFFIILGHIYPAQLSFKGGKGVSCLIGGVLAISWKISIILLLLFAVLLITTKKKTLSGIISIILLPLTLFAFSYPASFIIPAIFIASLIVYTYYRMNKKIHIIQ